MRYPDGTTALADIDLAVEPDEFVAVVGPSGCGKSTLLRAVAGLVPLAHGSCSVDRERLGYVFQDPTLLPWRTVRRNVELVGELRGVDAALRRRTAEEALDRVGLADQSERHPGQLSGGMRMRVSLARALTTDPTLFLLDEPFGALDELSRENMQIELQRLHLERPFAAVFVTHSVSEAVFLADRVLCMSPAPGRFTASVDVPFGRPRDQSIRYTGEFSALCRTVSDAVRGRT